ncbi:hypothetical protein [Desulfofundulus thermosubterraneus]|uniref:Uncharacterized protein n=1 Tax=Desulfofundulus thermosubterraneus DSM 16057 TaxID=1121432 RepID=A0A1M6FK63_9FIRM|nr:hypothetical protein [Desulfofundulus thermosubterraneus]SHI98110.1 hypothetical protein SAMN02745219_01499 [Desulfofundulus thermosubterraneus DSM 16057]
MQITLLSLLFIAIIALQVPPLVKKKMWRELVAFSVLLFLGMIYSYGLVLNLPLPNPARAVEAVFTPLTGLIQKALT